MLTCSVISPFACRSLSQTVTLFGAVHPLYMYNQENSAGNDVVVTFEDDDGVSEGGSSIVHLKKEMNLFQYFWISLFIVSSLYSFCWDVWMDWGLGRPEHKLLGPRLMFPHGECRVKQDGGGGDYE